MNICVFCSARDSDSHYAVDAGRVGELIGARGHSLVWGGSDTGTMKIVADAAARHGAKLYGVSVESLRDQVRQSADEMLILPTLAERKAGMLRRADAVAALPGGTGTLDEVTEIIELKKLGQHNKPVAFLNTNGFFEGLRTQLARMERDGFLAAPVAEFAYFADTPESLVRYIEEHGD